MGPGLGAGLSGAGCCGAGCGARPMTPTPRPTPVAADPRPASAAETSPIFANTMVLKTPRVRPTIEVGTLPAASPVETDITFLTVEPTSVFGSIEGLVESIAAATTPLG